MAVGVQPQAMAEARLGRELFFGHTLDEGDEPAVGFVQLRPDLGERQGAFLFRHPRIERVDAANRRVEIGSTWYARRVQRSALNTQCKLLLLTHAFEKLNCIAVEFRTHFFNHQSRRGIERLGAKQDGILRSHQIAPNGTLRDTVVYSIIASEWPTVKAHLTYQLNDKPR